MWIKIFTVIELLNRLFKLFADRRLIEQGKKEERANVDKAEAKAASEVQEIVDNIDSLPTNTVNERLSKWERD
jgi:hypothetical protein